MILTFLQTLRETGQPLLAPPSGVVLPSVLAAGKNDGERQSMEHFLRDWHDDASLSISGEPLGFHADAAIWGALVLFRAACFHSFREIVSQVVDSEMTSVIAMPDLESPAAHFSADLTLEYLPDVYQLIHLQDSDDLLGMKLKTISIQVPLSAVGIDIEVSPDSAPFQHEGITQMFIERAIDKRWRKPFEQPFFRDLAIRKLGCYHDELSNGVLNLTTLTNEF